MGATHDGKDLTDEFLGDLFMEKVAHAVHEDPTRLAPSKGKPELIGVNRDSESVLVARITHRLQPEGESFCVAVLATRADL
jgi:hypothetical protein